MLRNVILMVFAVCVLTACNQPAPVEQKIGIVDSARVFRESEPAKAGVKFLESIQADMQKKLTDMQEKIQKNPEDAALQQEIQATYAEFQQRIGAEEQNVINMLQEVIQRTIEDLRVSKKLDIVVGAEVALAYDKSLDLTEAIITEMNKQTVEYKAIVPDVPAEELVPTQVEPAKEEAPATTEAPKAEETPAATEAPKTE